MYQDSEAPIRDILIVGGGTAGWMTAAYLSKAFHEQVRITLIESKAIPTIGVGEATFSTIKTFFDFLELSEEEWMPYCSATYKLSIRFVNWNTDGRYFYHPFESDDYVDGFRLAEWWVKLNQDQLPYDYSCFISSFMCDQQKSPRFLDGTVFDERVRHLFTNGANGKNRLVTLADADGRNPYGYHLDANLLAKFLRNYAVSRGVKQVIDDVGEIKLAEDGSIGALLTKAHGELQGDLYIDCTGFQGLLIAKTLQEPFISFAESLLCDSAVAMRVPTDVHGNGINPFTTATALNAGWIWNIPLYGRNGTGYVYSSAYLKREQAEDELRHHLGAPATGCDALHLKMRIGRHRNSWVKNCVAIGLSSGFVEPLESTGLFFIQHGIEELVNHYSETPFPDEVLVQSYNKAVAGCIDGVRDFLVLHYHLSDRKDTPFWQATKHSIKVPEELQERLNLWRKRLPHKKSVDPRYHGFDMFNYTVMLLGLNYKPDACLPFLAEMDNTHALAAFAQIQQKARNLLETLPSHYEYLSHIRNISNAPDVYYEREQFAGNALKQD